MHRPLYKFKYDELKARVVTIARSLIPLKSPPHGGTLIARGLRVPMGGMGSIYSTSGRSQMTHVKVIPAKCETDDKRPHFSPQQGPRQRDYRGQASRPTPNPLPL